MKKIIINTGEIIDDADSVLDGIRQISGKTISDAELFKKFINNEKATRFHIDNKCSCKMQPDSNTIYLWLDSGFTDKSGNPIMISLLKTGNEYRGHYVGSFYVLSKSIRSFFRKNVKDIDRNIKGLRGKYEQKIADRKVKHIESEREYILSLHNGGDSINRIEINLEGIELCEEITEEIAEEIIEDNIEEEKEAGYDFNFRQKEITIGLLLDTIDDMENYIGELLSEIEKFKTADLVGKERMAELEAKNQEYKRAIVQMRTFTEEEDKRKQDKETEESVHSLLNNRKVLVLGATAIEQHDMNGIVKIYGFHKDDFEYETDYDKIVSFAARIDNCERYAAIILGACPHKVSKLGDWSSLIEKCVQSENMPKAYGTRNYSGELKITKESFKGVLLKLCEDLKNNVM